MSQHCPPNSLMTILKAQQILTEKELQPCQNQLDRPIAGVALLINPLETHYRQDQAMHGRRII